MGTVKQIDNKNRTYYFHNDIIYIENFKSNLLKIDKKSYKYIGIYIIGYITIKNNYSYLRTTHVSGYNEELNEILNF